ncbi:MAG: substrate-binding domain-containing protein [Microbacterium enclense]
MTPRTLRHRAVIRAGILAGVLAGSVVLGLAGCTATSVHTADSSDGAGVVGVALPSADDATWDDAGAALAEELRARGFRVDLQFAADDARTQASQMQNMLTKGTDAIVLAPLAGDAAAGPAQTAADDGVPVVVFGLDHDVPGARFVATADSDAVGRAQAEALLEAIAAEQPGPTSGDSDASTDATTSPMAAAATPRVAVLAGVAADGGTGRLHRAALDVLSAAADAGTIDIVSGATLESAAVADDVADIEALAAQRIDDLRAEDAPPTAVLALGDAVTRGTVRALTAPAADEATPSPSASATPSPSGSATGAAAAAPLLAVGSGADDDTVSALRDGALSATVIVDVRALAAAAADAVEALLDGEVPEGDGSALAGLLDVPAFVSSPLTVRASEADRARDLQDGGTR